jgi:fibronectin-binding autotransporter adhesin
MRKNNIAAGVASLRSGLKSNGNIERNRRRIASRVLATAVLASAVSAYAQSNQNWGGTTGGTGGAGTWNSSNTNWPNTAWVSGNVAVFGGSAGTVNVISPVVSGTEQPQPGNVVGTLTASGLTFNTTGYTLSSTTAGNSTTHTPGSALNLSGTSTPVITVADTDFDTIGAELSQSTLGGANINGGGQTADNFVLGGTQGFILTGGGTLDLDNPLSLTGGITIEDGSQLQVGQFQTIYNGVSSTTVVPTPILNYNSVTLNSSAGGSNTPADGVGPSLWVNTTNSIFSASNPNQYVGNINVKGSGTSTIYLARGNTLTSSSVKFLNSTINIDAGSSLNIATSGNTGNTSTAIMEFAGTNVGTAYVPSSATTFNAVEFSLVNPAIPEAGIKPVSGAYPAGPPDTSKWYFGTSVPATSGWTLQNALPSYTSINGTSASGGSKIFPSYAFGETMSLGNLTDNGNTLNFLSGGGAPVMLTSDFTVDPTNNPQFIQNAAAGDIAITSSTGTLTTATGVWNVGYNAAANPGTTYTPGRTAAVFGKATLGSAPGSIPGGGSVSSTMAYDGASLDLQSTSGAGGGNYGAAGITNNTINVSPYSQVHFDGSGFLNWGQAGSTINISGFGNTLSALSGSANAPSGGNVGALYFTSDTLATTVPGFPSANRLLDNVVLQSNVVAGLPAYYAVNGSATGPYHYTTSPGGTVISVGNSTASGAVGPTAAEIDGSITTAPGATNAGPFIKAGPGTLYLSGTGNSWPNGTVVYNQVDTDTSGVDNGNAAPNATSWTTGTVIYNGSLVVNSGSSLGGSGEPVTLYSTGFTNPTSTNLTLNTSQTIGTLYSVFLLQTGTASNTITLNNGSTATNLNIIQTASTTFGPGAVPTLSSSISGTGSISIDHTSTGSLTLAAANTYSGGTSVNGSALYLTNTSGSATGTGPITVTGSATVQPILGGNGTATGAATVTSGLVSPGVGVAANHLPGALALGGLTLNQPAGGNMATALTFSLNTVSTSDTINLGSGTLTLPGTDNTIPITLANYGALVGTTPTTSSEIYTLISYSGNGGVPVGDFNSLYLAGTLPGGFNFQLQNAIDKVNLIVTPQGLPLYWGGTSGNSNWDTAPADTNWSTTTPVTPASTNLVYTDGSQVIFDDSAPSTNVTVAGNVAPSLVTFNNNSTNYVLSGSGQITGTNLDILIEGTGSVTLANGGSGGNTFTGIVNVDHGGTLIVGADAELGNNNPAIGTGIVPIHLASDTTSALSTFEPSASFSSARTFVLLGAGGSLNIPASTQLTLTNPVIGPGDLYKDGTGILTLAFPLNGLPIAPSSSYNNTYVRAGTLQSGSLNPFPSKTAVTLSTGAILGLNGFNSQIGSLASALVPPSGPALQTGSVTLGTATLTTGNDGTNTTFNGTISGANGSVIKTGAGTWTLTGNNTFGGYNFATLPGATSATLNITGGLTISGGTISAADVYTPSTKFLSTGQITLSFGGTLNLTSGSPTTGSFDFSGNPTFTASNAAVNNYATPVLFLGTGGGSLVVPSGSNVNLPVLLGNSSSGNLTISGGNVTVTSAVVAGSSATGTSATTAVSLSIGNTGGAVVIGNGSDTGGDTLVLSSADKTGTPAIGTGGIIVNNNDTLWLQASQLGLEGGTSIKLGNFAVSGAASLGTLQINDGGIWKATGISSYTGTNEVGTPNPSSPVTPAEASITINVPGSSDFLISGGAWRSLTNGNDTNDVINVIGSGTYEITSGAITTAMYAGTWNIGLNSGGKFIIGQVPAGGGETLNALGYHGTLSSGQTNPVTVTGGDILVGVDITNPQDTATLGINSIRSNFTFNNAGSGTPIAIGSTGYQINVAASNVTLTFYSDNNHLVSAKLSGGINLATNSSVDILTNDPQNPLTLARTFNFTTNTTTTNGSTSDNFSWGNGATLTAGTPTNATGYVAGGVVNFGRINGNISIPAVANFDVNPGTTVNVGFIPGVTGVNTTANPSAAIPGETPVGGLPSGIDPFTENPVESSNTYANSVDVVDNGTMVWGGTTALAGDAGNGFKIYQVDSLNVGASASATLNTADTHADRTLLAVTGQNTVLGNNNDGTLSFGGTGGTEGKLDVMNNDMLIRGDASGNATDAYNQAITSSIYSDIKTGFSSGTWTGKGIYSSTAATDGTHLTAVGYVQVFTAGSFDGQAVVPGDVEIKYTYYGDADLSGHVDGTDYSMIDTGFGGGGTGWQYGDFNYDGHIDGSDYSLIDNTFNQQSVAGFASQVATPTSEIAAGGASSAVPEPASLGLLAIGALGLMTRRRRRA